jgi:hypothetical protein
MGAVALTALVANAASFGLLWAYRSGDANALGMDLHAQQLAIVAAVMAFATPVE